MRNAEKLAVVIINAGGGPETRQPIGVALQRKYNTHENQIMTAHPHEKEEVADEKQ